MISLCTDGEKCTKLADQGKCCKATCASISNINTFCNGLTPIDKTLLDSSKLWGPIHIDIRIPALLKGILYGSDDIFHLCFRAFHVLMPFRVLKKRIKCPKREAIVDVKSQYTFHKLLLFLGKNLSKWKTIQKV